MPPSGQPSGAPSCDPTVQPTSQPSGMPSGYPTLYPSGVPTYVPTSRPSGEPSRYPSSMPSAIPSGVPSVLPTLAPSSYPSCAPTSKPTALPSENPSSDPSGQPSFIPSSQPTVIPSESPSNQPSAKPSREPSAVPSGVPSAIPSINPTGVPSVAPSSEPTSEPSTPPSSKPTGKPIGEPSGEPSAMPSAAPSFQPSGVPTSLPSAHPSGQPTAKPTVFPSGVPSAVPTSQPTNQPTIAPTGQPSTEPSAIPTSYPTTQPTSEPSACPSLAPTGLPTEQPSSEPTGQPTSQPSWQPSEQPSGEPSGQPSIQPSSRPTGQPTSVPTMQPTTFTLPFGDNLVGFDAYMASCFKDCTYPGTDLPYYQWGWDEYCDFFEYSECSPYDIGNFTCAPSCLRSCGSVFCTSFSLFAEKCTNFIIAEDLRDDCLDSYYDQSPTRSEITFNATIDHTGFSDIEFNSDLGAQESTIRSLSDIMTRVQSQEISVVQTVTIGLDRRVLAAVTKITFTVRVILEKKGYSRAAIQYGYDNLVSQVTMSVTNGRYIGINRKFGFRDFGTSLFENANVLGVSFTDYSMRYHESSHKDDRPHFVEKYLIAVVSGSCGLLVLLLLALFCGWKQHKKNKTTNDKKYVSNVMNARSKVFVVDEPDQDREGVRMFHESEDVSADEDVLPWDATSEKANTKNIDFEPNRTNTVATSSIVVAQREMTSPLTRDDRSRPGNASSPDDHFFRERHYFFSGLGSLKSQQPSVEESESTLINEHSVAVVNNSVVIETIVSEELEDDNEGNIFHRFLEDFDGLFSLSKEGSSVDGGSQVSSRLGSQGGVAAEGVADVSYYYIQPDANSVLEALRRQRTGITVTGNREESKILDTELDEMPEVTVRPKNGADTPMSTEILEGPNRTDPKRKRNREIRRHARSYVDGTDSVVDDSDLDRRLAGATPNPQPEKGRERNNFSNRRRRKKTHVGPGDSVREVDRDEANKDEKHSRRKSRGRGPGECVLSDSDYAEMDFSYNNTSPKNHRNRSQSPDRAHSGQKKHGHTLYRTKGK